MDRSSSLFDWDDENEQHLLRHGIRREEAEAALRDPWLHPAPSYRAHAERRWGILGATESGRVLFLIFTRRGRLLRVVTARDATEREKHRYRRSRR